MSAKEKAFNEYKHVVREMYSKGTLTEKAIARKLQVSLTTVHRILSGWRDPDGYKPRNT